MNCDFNGNDLSSARMSGSQCGGHCESVSGCTHYTWSNYQGGTCWMKQGPVCKDSATEKSGTVCGFKSSSQTCTGIKPNVVGIQSGSALRNWNFI